MSIEAASARQADPPMCCILIPGILRDVGAMDTVSCQRAHLQGVPSALMTGLTLLTMAACAGQPGAPTGRGDIPIDGRSVHPESITSAADGSLFIGSMNGTIYRAGPKDAVAKPFILPSAE